jgi:hypothetical protein
MVVEGLSAIQPKTVMEVGCGADLLYQHYIHGGVKSISGLSSSRVASLRCRRLEGRY